jgi:DMSO/TMAO reductase YedYZ heme-binding membrane subunit
MTLTPRLRQLALTAHVAASVGWLGAVAAFVALGVVGLTSDDADTVRAAYLVMEPAAWLVLVPLALASLLTGLVQSLGTTWGLFRHYWVVFKLVINVFATLVLLLYMETFSSMAGVAADPSADLDLVRNSSPVLHAALAMLLLLIATILAVYKPRGMTPYGRRKQHEQRPVP